MSRIYLNQNNLKLTLQTGVTLTGAITTEIKYKKPDDSTGSLTATIDGTEDLFYEFAAEELDIVGTWTFWAYVVFSDGRNAPGEPVNIVVYSEGT